MIEDQRRTRPRYGQFLGLAMFASRWLQAPLYLGLIVAQGVYVWQFMVELWHIIEQVAAGMPEPAPGMSEKAAANLDMETMIMLGVLGLIDVVMISNLLIMVIVGGYETFVSRINLEGHPDQPQWLSHVNANVLKVKLAMAIVGISSIHLLQTFIMVKDQTQQELIWKTAIHVVFILSAIGLALIDRIMLPPPPPSRPSPPPS